MRKAHFIGGRLGRNSAGFTEGLRKFARNGVPAIGYQLRGAGQSGSDVAIVGIGKIKAHSQFAISHIGAGDIDAGTEG